MALLFPCSESFGAYPAAMLAYLADGDEARLDRAADLGTRALGDGVRASEMRALHHDAVRQILSLMQTSEECLKCPHPSPCQNIRLFLQSLTPADAVAAAGVFFSRMMAPFEARESELRRANAALRYHNDQLESRAHDFTQMIYDEGMQLLATARLALAEAAGEAEPAVCRPLDEVGKLLSQVEDQLAVCSDTLWPRILDDLGALGAIKALCTRLAKETGAEVKASLETIRLKREGELSLYKAVLEAFKNVQLHAHASLVHIHLYQEDSVVHCVIRDNGAGFDVPAAFSRMEHKGSGLALVQEKLRTVGGTILVTSIPEKGTDVAVSIDQTKTNQ
jgi:signal transduction histidine kinase